MSIIKKILLVYGSGGHNEQMSRLMSHFSTLESMNNFKYISLCDNDVKHILTSDFKLVPSVTNKFSYFRLLLNIPKRFIQVFIICKKIKKAYNPDFIISTGPGLCSIVGLYFKLFSKCKIIHIESWSRFYTKSLTGRFMYLISDVFYVQNIELQKKYPKSIFQGKL